MRFSIATALFCQIFISCMTDDLLLGEDRPAATRPAAEQNGTSDRATRSSDKAVVKDVVYGLEEERNHLYLTSQPLDGVDRQRERGELKFTVPQGAHVADLSLAKLNGKNLMAVIKVARGDEYDFHCLTFIAPPGGHARGRYGFHQAKFFTTRDDLKILAVGGRHFAGSVFIVLGDSVPDEKDASETITEGVFYFSGCPWPPSDGQLSPFHVESVRPKRPVD